MSPGRNGRYKMLKKLQELTHPLIISRYQKQGFDDFFASLIWRPTRNCANTVTVIISYIPTILRVIVTVTVY